MASYDPYDAPPTRERSTRRYYREERRDDRDPRYLDPGDQYLRTSRDLIPRPREDSDLSVEEIHRDFPPPGYTRDIRRARSADVGYYDDYDDRRSHYSPRDDRDDYYYSDRKGRKAKSSSIYYEEEERKRRHVLSQQEKIIAAIAGAALAVGGKELYDRHEAKEDRTDVHRNLLASAALGAVGAAAGYQGAEFYNKHADKTDRKSALVHKGRDGKVTYYSDDDEDTKQGKGNKNFLESALAAAGLGGAAKALLGGGHDDRKSDSRSDTRSRRGSRSRSRSKDRGPKSKIQKAAMASLIAGATEAFRVAKEPGAWKGEKAKRVLTAAAGAATIDAAQSSDHAGSKVGLAESVIGGLIGNRVLNGSKKDIIEDRRTGRSVSRSRSRARSEGGGGGGVSGLAALATAGLGAIAGKKILDNRERSRSRRRDDSYDSRDESPDRRRRSRSRSVVDSARRGLAKFGIGSGPEDDRRRDYDDDDDSRSNRPRHRRHSSDDYDDYARDRDYRRGGRDYDDDRSYGGRDRSRSRNRGGRASSRGSASSSDLGDSDEDEKRARKIRGKQILTTGLAAVATIHAAHNVYQSMEKRNARHKAVKEGKLSPEEAKKLKSKAILQDAASVGIAALGIKGAISELKEAREAQHLAKEWQEEKQRRHQRRLERQRQLRGASRSSNGDFDGRHRADSWSSSAPPRRSRYDDDGPRYMDGNPYSAALPAPPVGYNSRR